MNTAQHTGLAADPVARPLTGLTALVTGSLGAIGSAIVDDLAAAGASIGLHHLGQPEDAAAQVNRLRASGVEAHAVEADIRRWDETAAMVEEIESRLGAVDILVNNAGFMEPAPFTEMTLEQWRQTIDVDLTGVFVCSRHVVPGMRRRGRGVIINLSSQLAFKGAHDYTAYCAAKAGVAGLTRAMARELGPVIRVNAVAPGPVDTPFIAPWATDEWRDERTRDLVIRRLAVPEEVAPAVTFLASPAASLMHGQTLHINGGGVLA
jgi:3-oxoacyl-[acyl-carrier protein] reductase